jgi:hypothetical protein
MALCPRARDTSPRVSVRAVSRRRHALQGLPAFFSQPYAVYIRPSGLAHSYTVFGMPHEAWEGE